MPAQGKSPVPIRKIPASIWGNPEPRPNDLQVDLNPAKSSESDAGPVIDKPAENGGS
jgi:hypothetical protein